MKKILVAFDGSVYSEGALDYALHINKVSNSLITGVFIEDLSYIGFTSVFGQEYLIFDYDIVTQMQTESETQISQNINQFEKKCNQAGVESRVHHDKGVPVNELVKESIFADLIIIGYQTFFSSVNPNTNDFLKDILSDAECPILVVPEKFTPPENLIFTYDGDSNSVYAIKHFNYILGQLTKNNTATLLAVTENKEEELKNEDLIREYLSITYPDINIKKFQGDPEKEILYYAKEVPGPLLIMGAYGRNIFSRFFNKSVASKILKSGTVPIFISHK